MSFNLPLHRLLIRNGLVEKYTPLAYCGALWQQKVVLSFTKHGATDYEPAIEKSGREDCGEQRHG
jgi:hypothetical protein